MCIFLVSYHDGTTTLLHIYLLFQFILFYIYFNFFFSHIPTSFMNCKHSKHISTTNSFRLCIPWLHIIRNFLTQGFPRHRRLLQSKQFLHHCNWIMQTTLSWIPCLDHNHIVDKTLYHCST